LDQLLIDSFEFTFQQTHLSYFSIVQEETKLGFGFEKHKIYNFPWAMHTLLIWHKLQKNFCS